MLIKHAQKNIGTWQNTEKGESYIMGKIIDLSAVLEKEEKLQQVADYMEELKNQFSELIQEYEDDGVDAGKVDTLTEALDALEDAYDMVCEVAEDEK